MQCALLAATRLLRRGGLIKDFQNNVTAMPVSMMSCHPMHCVGMGATDHVITNERNEKIPLKNNVGDNVH